MNMKMNAKLAAGALTCVMFSGMLAGCGEIDGTADAITVNGETISVGAANLLLRYQQAETTTMMEAYGYTDLWDTEYSTTSEGDTITYGEEYKDSTETQIENLLLLKEHAEEYGVTIPEDLQASIEETAAASYEKNAEAFDAMGISEDSIIEALELETYEQLMYDPMVADTDREVSDDEAAQTTITYARISLTSTDDDGNSVEATDEEIETYTQQLELLIDQINNNDDPANADVSSLATAINEDIVSSSYSYGSDDTIIPDEVKEAVADLEDGETYGEVIETSTDYLYIVRLDAAFDEEATETEKESIISERESELYTETLEGWLEEAEITIHDGWENLTVTDTEVYEAGEEEEEEVTTDSTSTSEEVSSDSSSEEVTTDSTSTSESVVSES